MDPRKRRADFWSITMGAAGHSGNLPRSADRPAAEGGCLYRRTLLAGCLPEILQQILLLCHHRQQHQDRPERHGVQSAAWHPVCIFLYVLHDGRTENSLRAQPALHHVRAVHRRICLDPFDGQLGPRHAVFENDWTERHFHLRLWGHRLCPDAEILPAGRYLHERRLPGHRRLPARGS